MSSSEEQIDYSDIYAKYQVPQDESLDHALVVDGIPIIAPAKLEILLTKIAKTFTKKGINVKPEDLFVPFDDATGKSKGFLFAEFPSAEAASQAMAVMDKYQFDAKHTFLISRFTDIEDYDGMDETYYEPEIETYKPQEHLRSWLADEQGRDQYVTLRGDDVAIMWHSKSGSSPAHSNDKANWTDLYVGWSPLGTYLVTIFRQGVRFWAGPHFDAAQRFAHPKVKLIEFSPCEKYLITWSHDPVVVPDGAPSGPMYMSAEDEGHCVAIWEIKTGHLLRTFPAARNPNSEGDEKTLIWPPLKFSADDKYAARLTPGTQISVYELPSMMLVDKKSIKIEGVADFEWAPYGDKDEKSKKEKENLLAYWLPEVDNQPARVTLISFPSRQIVRQKNLFSVTDCKLYWQNQGDFLCVRVDRHTKTKKTLFCNLEIFRVREKECPVEVLELKDSVVDFSWEPKGDRFGIVTTSDPNLGPGITARTDVSFYQLDKTKNDFRLLRLLPNRSTNSIVWGPKGRHVVLATMGSQSKHELEFWDLDFYANDDRREGKDAKEDWGSSIQIIGSGEHYGMTDVMWDPSGRYVATSASAWTHTLENGYVIWDFKGQELTREILDRFKQFLWRPRPRTLLSKEEQRQVRKNLRDYSRAFEEEDAADESNVSAELLSLRKRLVDEWNSWRARCVEDMGALRKTRKDLGDDEQEEIEVWIDEVVDQNEEILE